MSSEDSLDKLSNFKFLLDPRDIEVTFDLDSLSNLAKPGSEKWKQLQLESYVTADSIYTAIGFSMI